MKQAPAPPTLKAPFPYFGGKARAAEAIWLRFGDVRNFVDPFCGSLAVLLARPHAPKVETVNDLDGYLINFWRALKAEPEAVAEWADWPVSESDLHARHLWLIRQKDITERLKTDPDFYDIKMAGWWVWGACAWIGQGWCRRVSNQLPHLSGSGQGINRQLPHSDTLVRNNKDALMGYFNTLSERLRGVRFACGDWLRVLGPSVTTKHGLTAILLDPPYGAGKMDYAASGNRSNLSERVYDWALAASDNPLIRIAVCGYEGMITFPDSWEIYQWKATGGYGSQGGGAARENCHRERIWFSPHCLKPTTSKDGHDEQNVLPL